MSPPHVQIYAKLEGHNPGGSVKDRAAKLMVECAEKKGVLTPDKIIVEPTSGNTGIALAMIATLKGYKITLVMPSSMSIERRLIMKAYGANLVLSPEVEGVDGAIRVAHEIADNSDKHVMLDQFSNPCNVRAHWDGTGEEIWNQTHGQITHFVAGIGTSGTIMGAGGRLQSFNPAIKVIGVEPTVDMPIQGLKNLEINKVPAILDLNKIDSRLYVAHKDAAKKSRQLAKQEGIFTGISSGAAMVGALQIAHEITEGTLVVIFPDGGAKYLSTPPYNGL
jgi:cysteine synthase